MFQYGTKNKLIENTDLITLEEAEINLGRWRRLPIDKFPILWYNIHTLN